MVVVFVVVEVVIEVLVWNDSVTIIIPESSVKQQTNAKIAITTIFNDDADDDDDDDDVRKLIVVVVLCCLLSPPTPRLGITVRLDCLLLVLVEIFWISRRCCYRKLLLAILGDGEFFKIVWLITIMNNNHQFHRMMCDEWTNHTRFLLFFTTSISILIKNVVSTWQRGMICTYVS